MSSSDGPHAFISYVREDSDLVDELENVLVEAGIPIWRDVKNLFPGDVWKTEIRKAIKGDALAFIPVFSSRSESRVKSQMREEIRLAIDEYRKMSPDRSWIFSIRLDEVQVPEYEISANQTLGDLNWTDFFGSRKTVEATRLVVRINQVLGQSGPAVASPASVAASATDSTRGEVLSAAVRDGLTDPSRAAIASELLIAETRRVVDGLNDPERFPIGRPEGSITSALLRRTEELSSLIAPLVEAAMELGARGKVEDAPLAAQLVSSLAREGFADQFGEHLEAFVRLRRFPALCVMVAGATGATARRNGPMLAAFVAEPRVKVYQRVMPVASVLSPWEPFGPSWEVAQFINATQKGGEVTQELLNAYDTGRVRRTGSAPASNIVGRLMSGPAARFAVGAPEFDELLERTEVLIGAIVYDWVLREGLESLGMVENWIGSRTRDPHGQLVTPMPNRVLEELEATGEDWWPLRDGGLFGRSPAAAMACMADYVETAAEARPSASEQAGW